MGVRSVEPALYAQFIPTRALEVWQEEGREIMPERFTNVKVGEVQQSYIKKDNIRSESPCQQSRSSNQIIVSAKDTFYSGLIPITKSVTVAVTGNGEIVEVIVEDEIDEPNSNEDGAGGKGATS